jgi:hypothetical protein
MRRASYQKKAPYYRARIADRQSELLGWLESLKAGRSCSRCGFSHPAVLQFHHRDPAAKKVEVAAAARQGWSRSRILAEIAKCDLLCANCHFIVHWEEKRTEQTA